MPDWQCVNLGTYQLLLRAKGEKRGLDTELLEKCIGCALKKESFEACRLKKIKFYCRSCCLMWVTVSLAFS